MAKKILVVDDDPYMRDSYEALLTDAGYDVDSASDGEQGLEKISLGGYDLILLDVMMPKLDGIGVLTKLSETPPKSPNGPIILLTNLANDPVIEEALQKGAKGCFIKSDRTAQAFVNEVKKYLT